MFSADANSRRSQLYRTMPVLLLILLAALTAWAVAAGASKPLPACVQNIDKVAAETSPWGTLRWLVSAKLEPQSNITFGVVEIAAGQSNPIHVHGNCDEVIYVVAGACEQRVGKETVVMKVGDALRIPAGVPHTAKALGEQPVRTIVAYNAGERQFTPVEKLD
jgi:quercetin dioxygenase-like cupin family protein